MFSQFKDSKKIFKFSTITIYEHLGGPIVPYIDGRGTKINLYRSRYQMFQRVWSFQNKSIQFSAYMTILHISFPVPIKETFSVKICDVPPGRILCWYKILQPLNGLCCLIHMFLLWRSDLKINVYLIYLKISFVLCKYIYTRQISIVTQDSGTDNCTHHCLLCYMFAIKRIRQPKHQVHHVFNKYTIQNNKYSSKLIYRVSSRGNFCHEITHFFAYNLPV